MKKILIICGPTATGKTELSAHLAIKFNGELVSADSRQVYKDMDLVTGKDRPDVPIWLYDVVSPNDEFSVSHWVRYARRAISDIQKREKLPIVVGGTGLYIKALLDPFETIDIPPNLPLRKKLQKLTLIELQSLVQREDMNQSDWNNPRRLMRKIEVSKSKKNQTNVEKFDHLMIGLTAPLSSLYKRIDERYQQRQLAGMNEEIGKLTEKYSGKTQAMSAIGVNEHGLARRQMTWFRKISDIHWFNIDEKDFNRKVEKLVMSWYT